MKALFFKRSLCHPALLTSVVTLGELLVERDANLMLVVLALVAAGVCRVSTLTAREGQQTRA
jgi:hypothetical protein